MDDLDYKILNMIENNIDFTLQEIADNLGISKGTVRNRINKMINNGILMGWRLKINYKNLGKVDSYVGLDIQPEYYVETLENLKKLDFVKELYSTTGDHVAIAYIVSDEKEIMEKVKLIANIQGVRKVYPAFVQGIIK